MYPTNSSRKFLITLKLASYQLTRYAVLGIVFATVVMAAPARAAFHLWSLRELYSNSSGSLQFVEMVDFFGGQNFVGGQQIQVANIGNTITHTFTLPSNLPGDTSNQSLLFGTAGIQAAGGPAPDFIIPDGFLFTAGGTITFFGLNSGSYPALPTDGVMSHTWGDGVAVNSSLNYSGASGTVVVPEPTMLALFCVAGMAFYSFLRRRSA